MRDLLVQLWVVVAATLVLALPGGPLAVLLGLRRCLPAYLQPAIAIVLSLLSCSAALAVTFVLDGPIWWVLASQLVLTALATAWGLRRARRGGDVRLARWLVAAGPAGWLLGMPRAVQALALLTGAWAFVVGGWLTDGDMLYHTGVARKLLELEAPGPATTQLFADGSLHPGYALPAWHELAALTALVAQVDVATVMWLMVVPVAVAALLAAAGLAFVLFRSHEAALAGAVVFLLVDAVGRGEEGGALSGAMSLTSAAVNLLLPLAVAAWVLALHHPRRGVRGRSLLVLLACVPALVVVHVSYVAWLGLAVLGYLLVWLVLLPWPWRLVRRHVLVGLTLLAVTVAGLAAMYPVLTSLGTFASGPESAAIRGEMRDFAAILVGSQSSYHLRPDVLVAAAGGLALLGLLCAPLALLRLREPGAWYVAGTTLLVLVLALQDRLFVLLAGAMSISQAKRLQLALPYEAGLVLGVLLLAAVLDALRRRWRGGGLVLALVVAAGLSLAVAWLVGEVAPLPSLKDPASMPAWPFTALLAVLAVGTVAAPFLSRRGGRDGRSHRRRRAARLGFVSGAHPPDEDDGPAVEEAAAEAGPRTVRGGHDQPHRLALRRGPAVPASASSVALALLCLAVGASAPLGDAAGDVRDELRDRPANGSEADDLGRVDARIARELRAQFPGEVVMTSLPVALRVHALAPLYVVGAPLAHVAGTEANRKVDRRDAVRTFFAARTSDEDRLAVLDDERADLLLLDREDPADRPARELVAAHDDEFRLLAQGPRQELYRWTGRDRDGAAAVPDADAADEAVGDAPGTTVEAPAG